MNLSRRGFLKAAAVVAPAVILTPGLLMPVRRILSGDYAFVQSGTGATSMTLGDVFRNRYVWIHNEGSVLMTVSGVELPDRYEPAPPFLELQPGQSACFQTDARCWSRWEAGKDQQYVNFDFNFKA